MNRRRTARLEPTSPTAWNLIAPDGTTILEDIPQAIVRDRIIDRPDYGTANDRLREVFGDDVQIAWFDGVLGSRSYWTDLDAAVLID